MPTLIDSLVVKLSFDTSDLKPKRVEAEKELKQTKDAAVKTAKDMQTEGARAAEFFGAIKTEALSLLGILVGAGSIEEFARRSTNSLADLGRSARNIGESVPDLAAFRNMIERYGGSADAAATSLQNLADQQERLKVFGQASTEYLGALGVVHGQRTDTPLDVLSKFQSFIQSTAGNPEGDQRARLVGRSLGLDQGTVTALLQLGTLSAMQRELQRSRELGVPDKAMTDAMAKLQNTMQGLIQAVDFLGLTLLTKIAPGLESWLAQITKDVKHGLPTWDELKNINPDLTTSIDAGISGIRQYLPQWLGGTGSPGGKLPADIEAEVRRQAGLRGLDPDHMVRLYQKEHGGYNNTSPAGAFGPSQLMPGTAARYGVNKNSPWQQNVRGGLDYYQFLLKLFNGNYAVADAAYNAGEHNPGVKWFAQTGDPSHLPAETKDYINSINQTPNGVPKKGPIFGPQNVEDHRLIHDKSLFDGGPRGWHRANGSVDNSSDVSINNLNIHTQATDAHGIAVDLHKAISDALVTQADTGLH